MATDDRKTLLCSQTSITGIDFIEIDTNERSILRVFFVVKPTDVGFTTLFSDPDRLQPKHVEIVRADDPEFTIAVEKVELKTDLATLREYLEVATIPADDASPYRLTIVDPLEDLDADPQVQSRIDRFFNGVEFSFFQHCPSDFDCQPEKSCVCPETQDDPPIDYLARDFTSYRNAMLDFAAQRYPEWGERIEADVGMMMLEVMAAYGDEMSYIQDRIFREGFLESASQRRSIESLTRLVDYQPGRGQSATTWLDLQVSGADSGTVPGREIISGTRTWAAPEGEAPIPFEIGESMADLKDERIFYTHESWNAIEAYLPDPAKPCLSIGSREMYLKGNLLDRDLFPEVTPGPDEDDVYDPLGFWVGKSILLQSDPSDDGLPAQNLRITVTEIEHLVDPLCSDQDYTRIRWSEEESLRKSLDLRVTTVHANLLPAVAGETIEEHFVVRQNEDLQISIPQAVERGGSTFVETPDLAIDCSDDCHEEKERLPIFRYSLRESTKRGLGFVGSGNDPEICVDEAVPNLVDDLQVLEPLDPPVLWYDRRSLLNSESEDLHYRLEAGTWLPIITFERDGQRFSHHDYAHGEGFTLRFGDGDFGSIPQDGTIFRVRYRTNPASRANLPPGSVSLIDAPSGANDDAPTLSGKVSGVANPLPITNGRDPEPLHQSRVEAPSALRGPIQRAVQRKDYAEIASREASVDAAKADLRWTGSWLTQMVTPDPANGRNLSEQDKAALEARLDCSRMLGQPIGLLDPQYLNLDLEVYLCLHKEYDASAVKRAVIRSLEDLLQPENLTFGSVLEPSEVIAAAQSVAGVKAVQDVRVRQRGLTVMQNFEEEIGGPNTAGQILRVANDPRYPERGTIKVYEGEAPTILV